MNINTLPVVSITFSNGKTHSVTGSAEAYKDPEFRERATMINCAAFAKENGLHALKEELKLAIDSEFGKDNDSPFLAAAKILMALDEQRKSKD